MKNVLRKLSTDRMSETDIHIPPVLSTPPPTVDPPESKMNAFQPIISLPDSTSHRNPFHHLFHLSILQPLFSDLPTFPTLHPCSTSPTSTTVHINHIIHIIRSILNVEVG